MDINFGWQSSGTGGSTNILASVTEKFTVTQAIIDSGLDIQNTPNLTNEHLFVIWNGIILDEGQNNDFEINTRHINFYCNLEIGDKIIIKYKH
jgi:hypothetical protein